MTIQRINSKDISQIGNIFLAHRGRAKGLFKEQLYEKFYGKKWNKKSTKFYEQVAKWKYLRALMKYLRKKGDHFIIYEPLGIGKFKYYLLSTRDEGEQFKAFIQKIIDAHKETQKRVDKYMEENLKRRALLK